MEEELSSSDIERLAAVIAELRRTLRRAGAQAERRGQAGPATSEGDPQVPRSPAGPGRRTALTGSELEVLRFVASHPGVGTNGIASALRLRANTVSGVCGQLIRAGHLERRTDPGDGRAAQFYPTEATIHRRAEKTGRRAEHLASALERLPTTDHTAINAALPALERLVAELDALSVLDR